MLLALSSQKRLPAGMMATTMSEEKRQLKGQLIHIMDYKKKSNWAIALMLAIAILLTGCATVDASLVQSEKGDTLEDLDSSADFQLSEPTENETALLAYKAVLNSSEELFYADTGEYKTLEAYLAQSSEILMFVHDFAVIDLDADGADEVILGMWKGLGEQSLIYVLILHYDDGIVYGYSLPMRGFRELKADGTFLASSSASDSRLCTIAFVKGSYVVDKYTYRESVYTDGVYNGVAYYINRQSATEQEWNEAIEEWNNAPDAMWHDFTEENILSLHSPYTEGQVVRLEQWTVSTADGLMTATIELKQLGQYQYVIDAKLYDDATNKEIQKLRYDVRDDCMPETIDNLITIADVNGDGSDDIVLDLGIYGQFKFAVCYVYDKNQKCYVELSGYDELMTPEYVSGYIFENWRGDVTEYGINKYVVNENELILIANLNWKYGTSAPLFTEMKLINGVMTTTKKDVDESEINAEEWNNRLP